MPNNPNLSLVSANQVAATEPSSLLDLLRRAADTEQLHLHPLPVHAAAQEEEHLRQHYALLLAALLTAQPVVSEPQSRLFMLLLNALQLGDRRAAQFEQARELTPDSLIEAARLIREQGYAEELLVDALVLLRLDAPLSDETTQLLSELAAFLGLAEITVQRRSQDAAQILGLGENRNEQLAKNWPKYIPYALTKDALKKGLDGGLWHLEQNLAVNFSWHAQDAVLVFSPGITLHTEVHEGTIKLTHCHLNQASLNFVGKGNIELIECNWQGDYTENLIVDCAGKNNDNDNDNKASAIELFFKNQDGDARAVFSSTGLSVLLSKSNFTTRNSAAILVNSANLDVRNCQFINCGSEKHLAGAIIHNPPENTEKFGAFSWLNSKSNNKKPGDIKISNCRFTDCIGSKGGALWLAVLRNVSSCEFISCQSTRLSDLSDLAVYTADEAQGNPALTKCIFRMCSLFIGDANWSYTNVFVTQSQFQDGNIYHRKKHNSQNRIQSDCIFNDGRVIEKII